jgi:conjugative transposon TraN protein
VPPRFVTGDAFVGYNKTTILLFPYAVRPGDIGSREVIAQKIKGVDNAVKVKAAHRNFAPTNLSVFTADGKLYSINLHYSDTLEQPVYVWGDGPATEGVPFAEPVQFSDSGLDQADLDSAADAILSRRGYISHPAIRSEKVHAAVKGIYYEKGLVFVRLTIRNRSYIPYEVDFSRTAIEKTTGSKRKAKTSEPLTPLYAYGLSGDIDNHHSRDILLVYPKFTLSRDRRIVIRLYEHEGHRDLVLPIRAGTVSRARPADVYRN